MSASDYDCVCVNCVNSMDGHCQTTERANHHCGEVTNILFQDLNIMTVTVGKSKIKLTCHKVLLSFYSEFFRAACYGGFLESTKRVITMPEDDPTEVAAFISWCYTGKLYTHASFESIWILGDKLQSTDFMNEAMYSLFNQYGNEPNEWISAAHAELVYENTNPNSLLRSFVRGLIATHPPLSKAALEKYKGTDYEQAWKDLLKKGGPLVLDVISLMDDGVESSEMAPYTPKNQAQFILPVQKRSVPEWVEKYRSQFRVI